MDVREIIILKGGAHLNETGTIFLIGVYAKVMLCLTLADACVVNLNKVH